MWRRPRLVTADTKSPATAAWQTCQGAWSLRAGPGNGDGGGTWANNATAERREAGLPVAREGPCLASVASRVTCATTSRLDASRRSANSPRSGVGCDEGEEEEREEPGRETSRERRNWAV